MTSDLEGYQWSRKNNVAMRESNDNIDHKNVVIIWISFADEAQHFS